MYIQFQGVKYKGGACTTRKTDDQTKFFDSLSGGANFNVYVSDDIHIELNIVSAKKMMGSNGYMEFIATATYPASFHIIKELQGKELQAEVEGIISFKV